jgi:hypothetical protein
VLGLLRPYSIAAVLINEKYCINRSELRCDRFSLAEARPHGVRRCGRSPSAAVRSVFESSERIFIPILN